MPPLLSAGSMLSGTWPGPQRPSVPAGVLSGMTLHALGWRPWPLPLSDSALNWAHRHLGSRSVQYGSVRSAPSTGSRMRLLHPSAAGELVRWDHRLRWRQRPWSQDHGLHNTPWGIFPHCSAVALVGWGVVEGGNQPTSSYKS